MSYDPTSLLAQQLRRDIRARRRAFPDGQRFVYKDLRELWSPPGQDHVVLTHRTNPNWQHWARHYGHGWIPIGIYPERGDATAAAENHEWEPEWPEPDLEPGVYVLAGWPRENDDIAFTVRTRCSSKNSAIAVADTLRSVGMITKHEEIHGDQ